MTQYKNNGTDVDYIVTGEVKRQDEKNDEKRKRLSDRTNFPRLLFSFIRFHSAYVYFIAMEKICTNAREKESE